MSEPRDDDLGLLRTLTGGLWFPIFFFFGFLFCYMLPFHNPTPHDVSVAVSSPAAAGQVRTALSAEAPGAFEILTATDAADAKQQVLDRDAVASYAVGDDGKATLYVAKANGSMLESVVEQTFEKVAGASSTELTTTEVAPTASGDATGTSLFYLTMAWTVVPYVSVMMMLRVVTLSRRAKLLTFAGVGAFITAVAYLIGLAVDVIPNEPLALVYAFAMTQLVAWVTYGLVPYVKQFIPGVAIGLFVLLNIPSSGGAIPYQMVPGIFRWLHPVMPLGNLVDVLHGVFYFDNKGLLRPTLVLCAWLAAGATLVAAGVLRERRLKRRAADTDGDETSLEAVVEDPSIEAPTPHATRPGHHSALGETPMVYGTVTEESGTAFTGAQITVIDAQGRQLTRTRTDENGAYGLTGMPEQFLIMILSAPGRRPATTPVLPQEGRPQRKDFVMPGERKVPATV
ncbi:carboxypeptidase regulatory-like domain-containing protein [Streptomyces sp. NPDC102441]|uniref:carboxypeptidase regulatory-like domain-containing protein n=1 Tax=Streptomyces sp. NPDC102441 TaxID=3366176 RepID=UPI00382667DD